MAFIAWLIAMMIVSAIVYQMWLFDCLIRCEYEHHREQWERDGKPSGFFWHPKEREFWSSNSAMHRLAGVFILARQLGQRRGRIVGVGFYGCAHGFGGEPLCFIFCWSFVSMKPHA